MSADRDIDGWLAERGVTLMDARVRARGVLEEAGLTRPGKARMSEPKLLRAAEVLAERFFQVCADPGCLQVATASGREPLRVEPRSHCARCGGSANRRAEVAFVEMCHQRGVQRVVVVGGSPAVREELEAKLGGHISLRMVDGTERRTADRAKSDLEWADLVLVWGATELHHKVSTHYTHLASSHHRKVVHVVRRGVAALLDEAMIHLQRAR
ncbi:hypothetical protein NR800_15725 [Corallococcus interemptor]|uniref:hypothetical protein n=1 Tax=Corallococcus TaxID=83461 RepID=UPI001CBF8642|nr:MULTISPECIES: hypothetical protein [unclassified Corallococcus]MBZ4334096.1 hypothetical protein [Corallococcus sp. AS-1-12]MBZ4371024.1 hypothetical protein [Corallococcus sp. AS-1-6]